MLSIFRSRPSGPAGLRSASAKLLSKPMARQQAHQVLSWRTFSTSVTYSRGEDWKHQDRYGQRNGGFQAGQRDGGFRSGQRNGGFRSGQRDGGFRSGPRQDFNRRPGRRGGGLNRPSEGALHDQILEGNVQKRDNYITKFSDLGTSGQVSQVLVDTITGDMKLETMTPVQSQTITETLEGVDV